VPGKKITDQQVRKYKAIRRQATQEIAAARMGISVRSARRIEKVEKLPSQHGPRTWRTRADPLAGVWEAELVPLLEAEPRLQGRTLFEELQQRHGERFGDGILRTLQRRVRAWRAEHGNEKEIYFAQANPPGRLALSDFTVCDSLGVIVAGEAFPHRLYQCALAYSGWRHAEVVRGGESFAALAQGMQNALWALGGAPEEHRTDSLSAAFNNLAEQEELTRRYSDLCKHYGLRASRNNLGESHENGSIESRQGSLKNAIDQALLLRGHRSFDELTGYRQFIADVVARMNRRVSAKVVEERAALKPLPVRRTSEYEETDARVTKFSTVSVKRILYSVPSRLIGHRPKFRVYPERIEAWLGDVCVFETVRGVVPAGKQRGKLIDYRHLISTLKRKPGAFARWVLRDDMFPRAEYRLTWERLSEKLPERQACKVMVGLLDLAVRGACEVQLANVLGDLLQAGTLPELAGLEEKFAPKVTPVPDVSVELPPLADYDALMGVAA
jgi:transposase InsO family protein